MKKLTKELKEKLLDDLEGYARLFSIAVAPIYAQLDWRWQEKDVPGVKEIENHILQQISTLRSKDSLYLSCGGLTVRFENEENKWAATISFVFDTTVYE